MNILNFVISFLQTVYGVSGDGNEDKGDMTGEMENLRRQCEMIKKIQQEMKPKASYFKMEVAYYPFYLYSFFFTYMSIECQK